MNGIIKIPELCNTKSERFKNPILYMKIKLILIQYKLLMYLN